MFSAADQISIIAAMPSSCPATVGSSTITVDFRTESEPVLFADGSLEQGQPFCIVSAADVTANSIDHGTVLTIGADVWYVIRKRQKQDGMYRLFLSLNP
jgi:hypothetical protein